MSEEDEGGEGGGGEEGRGKRIRLLRNLMGRKDRVKRRLVATKWRPGLMKSGHGTLFMLTF